MQNHMELIFFSHIVFITINYAAAYYIACGDTGNFTANSSYANNRYQILSSLAPNVSTNGGFFNTTIGQEPNKVYALGLCRGDDLSESCFDCVDSISQELMTQCPYEKEAFSWEYQRACLVRYANRSFFGQLELAPVDARPYYKTGNTSYSNITEFDQIWEALMGRVINRTSSGTSRIKYATEEARRTFFGDIYALMQCTPDLSQSDCITCLTGNVDRFQSCCQMQGYQGGIVLRPNCYFRWGMEPFYYASASSPAPSLTPPPSPSPSGSSPPTNANGPPRRKVKVYVVGFVASFGSLTMILFCVVIYNKRKILSKNHQELEAIINAYGPLPLKRHSFYDVKKITCSFKDKLGQGGYGCVYKGKQRDGRLVAVKLLNTTKANGKDFMNEVLSITRTSHTNIVTLLGFCLEGSKRALIYEFMSNGSLDQFIHNKSDTNANHYCLGWENLYRIAIEIAQGLEYLHRGCKTRILHFDIKPHNILLDEHFCPKISDFGLAKLCNKKESIVSIHEIRGTIGYIAPEVFNKSFGGVSHKSDVYSYGMMILEMVGVKNNANIGGDNSSDTYFPHWIYKRLEKENDLGLSGGVTTELEDEVARKMVLVGLWCIQTDPSQRPNISEVLDMLKGSIDNLQIPPRPFVASPSRSLPLESFSSSVL